MESTKRIAVVGAGMSGLTSIKACLEEGFEPLCFEASDNIGGLWRYRDEDVEGRSSLMKSTIINSSKEVSAFSDFPPPKEFPNFMHNRLMCRYLELYAHHFGLIKYIRFHCKIDAITCSADYAHTGKWALNLTYKEPLSNKVISTVEIFDGVMICTGHLSTPHIPSFDGLSEFGRPVIHTHSYKVPDQFVDKKVLVVGTGNSGADVTVELSLVAEQVYLSTRRGFWIRNRVGPQGYPSDTKLMTRSKVYWWPTFYRDWVWQTAAEDRLDYDLYGIRPHHKMSQQHPTISDALPNRIVSGTVKIKGQIRQFVKGGVHFEGEKDVVPIDAVVLATGYTAGFPILDKSFAKIDDLNCQLYMYVFPPNLKHSTLAFIGNVQPIGPVFPISELQARWFVQILKGSVKLPSKNEMQLDVDRRTSFNKQNYISGSRHVTEVTYLRYCDEVAERFGARPKFLWMFFSDNQLFRQIYFGPPVAYQFRLRGPHKWGGARHAILTCQERVRAALLTNSTALKKVTFNFRGLFFYKGVMFLCVIVPGVTYFRRMIVENFSKVGLIYILGLLCSSWL